MSIISFVNDASGKVTHTSSKKCASYIELPKENKKDLETLFSNLDLILANKQEILGNKEFYNISLDGPAFGGIFFGGSSLYLGDLIALWIETSWHEGDNYYYSIVGSPLSGANSAHWWNNKTKKFESGRYAGGWGKLGFVAGNYIQHGSFKIASKDPRIIYETWKTRSNKTKYDIYNFIEYLKSK